MERLSTPQLPELIKLRTDLIQKRDLPYGAIVFFAILKQLLTENDYVICSDIEFGKMLNLTTRSEKDLYISQAIRKITLF